MLPEIIAMFSAMGRGRRFDFCPTGRSEFEYYRGHVPELSRIHNVHYRLCTGVLIPGTLQVASNPILCGQRLCATLTGARSLLHRHETPWRLPSRTAARGGTAIRGHYCRSLPTGAAVYMGLYRDDFDCREPMVDLRQTDWRSKMAAHRHRLPIGCGGGLGAVLASAQTRSQDPA